MNLLKTAFCRTFQTAFRMALPVLPYREPEIIGSCADIGKVVEKENIRSVLIVTDKGVVNIGLAKPVMMPYVLEAYGKRVYKKLHRLGIAAGVAAKEDTHMAGAIKFINAVKELNTRMNIPTTLTGIQKRDIDALAKHAEKEANPLYPVPVLMTKKQLKGFYYKVADWSKENDERTSKKSA